MDRAVFPATHVLSLPPQANVTYFDRFLKMARQVREIADAEIVFDLSQTRELSALSICFLCGLVDAAYDNGNSVKIRMPTNKRAASAVRAIKVLTKTVGRPKILIEERMCQLRKITTNNQQPVHDLVDLIGYQVDLSEDLKFNIKLALTELLTNAIDHSGEKAFYVCAGAWGRANYLHFAALDFGMGIPQRIRLRHPKYDDDREILNVLLTQGITTRSGREGGEGYRHIRKILRANEGRLHLFTGGAKAILRFDRQEYIYRKARKQFVGTCLDLQFDLNNGGPYSNINPAAPDGRYF